MTPILSARGVRLAAGGAPPPGSACRALRAVIGASAQNRVPERPIRLQPLPRFGGERGIGVVPEVDYQPQGGTSGDCRRDLRTCSAAGHEQYLGAKRLVIDRGDGRDDRVGRHAPDGAATTVGGEVAAPGRVQPLDRTSTTWCTRNLLYNMDSPTLSMAAQVSLETAGGCRGEVAEKAGGRPRCGWPCGRRCRIRPQRPTHGTDRARQPSPEEVASAGRKPSGAPTARFSSRR